jgi:hypothetical protein
MANGFVFGKIEAETGAARVRLPKAGFAGAAGAGDAEDTFPWK